VKKKICLLTSSENSYRAVQVSLAKMRISWLGTFCKLWSGVSVWQVTKESVLCCKSVFLTNAVVIWLHKWINLHTYIYKIQRKEEVFVKANQQYIVLLVSQEDHNVPCL